MQFPLLAACASMQFPLLAACASRQFPLLILKFAIFGSVLLSIT
jgi:hypothetical protein